MNCPAQIILSLRKSTEPFWLGFGSEVVGGVVQSVVNDVVIGHIPVKHYDLHDHQFVHVRVDLKTQKDVTVLIPRSLVTAVFEGEKIQIGFLASTEAISS